MREDLRSGEYDPTASRYFWVEFFAITTDQGKTSVDTTPFLRTRARFMGDILEAGIGAQQTSQEIAFAIQDSGNNEIPDHARVFEELKRRQEEFAETAKPQDWEYRRMARVLESILDRTYLPSPALSGLMEGILVSETTAEDLQRRNRSEVLAELVRKAEEILSNTSTTASFKEFVINRIKLAYRFGVHAEGLLTLPSIGLDLDNNHFPLFDPGKTEEIERWAYNEEHVTVAGIIVIPGVKQKLHQRGEEWRRQFKQHFNKEL